MKYDYEKNHRLFISIDYSEHPVFSVIDNIVFRTCHDLLIHLKGNFGFETGEINAYNLHARLAPKDAVPALFTELVGQAAYVMARGKFPVQKIDVFKGFDFYKVGEVDDYIINDKTLQKKPTEEIPQDKELEPELSINHNDDSIYNKDVENMKSMRLTETELKTILKDYIKEGMSKIGWMGNTCANPKLKTEGLYDNNGDDQTGAVELNKQTNPNDIKKYTSQGMDVKLVDENKMKVVDVKVMGEDEFGADQPLVMKHKFEGDKLNIYCTKDKTKLNAIMDYILTIKDQLRVHQALASNNVTLFIKDAPSGRYIHMGNISQKLYDSYLKLLKSKKTVDFAQKTELNENILRLLIK